ncbi:MAG: hypothetical protein QM766_19390 [Burkholderiaceae bacterium]
MSFARLRAACANIIRSSSSSLPATAGRRGRSPMPALTLAALAVLAPIAAAQAQTQAQTQAAESTQEPMPAHKCEAPLIPPQITSQVVADQIRGQVDAYKQCIQDFATAQQALADRHNKAANAAIAEFNQFVQTKLPAK